MAISVILTKLYQLTRSIIMSNQVLFTAKQSLLKVYVCRDLLTDYEALSNDIPQAQLLS